MIRIYEPIIGETIKKYGKDKQLVVAIEEMSELTKEICKSMRGKVNREHIIEETADVMIMLVNITEIFNITDEEINDYIIEKQTRMTKRMKGELKE